MVNSIHRQKICTRKFFLQYLINFSSLIRASDDAVQESDIVVDLLDCDRHHFVQLEDSKFYYSLVPKNWEDAQTECLKVGLNEATIDHSVENIKLGLRLMETFSKLMIPRTQRVWIGAKDTNLQGIYEWVDGTPMVYTNYGSPLPDTDIGKHICLDVGFPPNDEATYLEWKHEDCGKIQPFLCETEKKECFSSYSTSKEPLLRKMSGTNYYISLQKRSWADALELCESQNLILISLLSQAINDEVGRILGLREHRVPKDFIFWTSGSHHIVGPEKILWMSNGVIANDSWNAWRKEETSYQNSSYTTRIEMCVGAKLLRGSKIEWDTGDCTALLPFLCTVRPTCYQGRAWVLKAGNIGEKKEQRDEHEVSVGKKILEGFYFTYAGTQYFLAKQLDNWRGALKRCLERGMDLYTPNTDEEHKAIANFLWRHKSSRTRCKYWIAGLDLGSPHKHYWIDSAISVPGNKTYFDKGVAKDAALPTCLYLQLCTESIPDERNYQWKVQSCNDPDVSINKLSIICEKKKCTKSTV